MGKETILPFLLGGVPGLALNKKLLGNNKSPTINPNNSASALTEELKKTRKSRVVLNETGGGGAGEEVMAGGVSNRNTIFGN